MIPLESIAFDIDGVVADTMGLFIQIAHDQFHMNIQYEDITNYDLTKCLNIDFETVWVIIEQILSGKMNHELKPIDSSAVVLQKLSQYSDALLFVTARPDDIAIRKWFIETLGLSENRHKIIATGNFEQKATILKEHNIRYFVEDRMETCRLLSKERFVPIVYRHPWNRESHTFIEVSSWDEIDALIDI
jgi:hypothetical protein